MSHKVEIDRRAVREWLRLPKVAVQRIREAILGLAVNPRPPGAKKLTAREGYRVRVGDDRILYEVEDKVRLVRVYRVGHRKQVYR